MNLYIAQSANRKTLRLVMADSRLVSVKAVSGNLEPEAISPLEEFKITHKVGSNVTTLFKSVSVDSAIELMRDNVIATSKLGSEVVGDPEIINTAEADLEFLIEIRAKRPEVFPSTKLGKPVFYIDGCLNYLCIKGGKLVTSFGAVICDESESLIPSLISERISNHVPMINGAYNII